MRLNAWEWISRRGIHYKIIISVLTSLLKGPWYQAWLLRSSTLSFSSSSSSFLRASISLRPPNSCGRTVSHRQPVGESVKCLMSAVSYARWAEPMDGWVSAPMNVVSQWDSFTHTHTQKKNKQAGRETDGQAGRATDRQTGRDGDRQA